MLITRRLQVRGIIRVRLHSNRGNPVISSEGESCAIHSSLKKDFRHEV